MRISKKPRLPRAGVTLIEVLVAIFVASIGLLALMALFPVGALSMKQALRDSRCAQSAANAMAIFKSQKLAQNPDLNLLNGLADPFVDGTPAGSIFGYRLQAAANGPSYPLYIDPLGATFKSTVPPTNNHLPLPITMDIPATIYPRILRAGVNLVRPTPSAPPDATHNPSRIQLYLRWFSLHDEIAFNQDYPGLPCKPVQSPNLIDVFSSDTRYSYAYMVRRPYAANSSTYDVTIVVYSGRSISASLGAIEELAFNGAQFVQGSTSVRVPFSGSLPAIKAGGWILDASMFDQTGTMSPQGYFYRVVDVLDNGDSTMTVELQTPARQSTTSTDPAKQGMMLYLDNVAEVFEKGTVSLQ
jgi:prepilin-type N-terminal cleavage/methylation domain-containing protein